MSALNEPDPPRKRFDNPVVLAAQVRTFDRVFFGLGTLASIWLAVEIAQGGFAVNRWGLLLLVLFWAVLAYLALPRVNRILTTIYVPDYFIGRARTSDGLLGDPLNLALRGSPDQVATAMSRAGWIVADPVTIRSSVKIIQSTLARRSYPGAPVSPLLLFERLQDVAFEQQVAGNPAQRHHVRMWRTPDGWLLPGGHRVDWLAAGTYDKRVGLSLFTLQVTHKVDANIDVERDHVISTVQAANPEVSVDTLVDFTSGYHSRNGGGDLVETDGNLPILEVGSVEPKTSMPIHDPTTGLPVQIWFPAVLLLVASPLLAVFVLWHRSSGAVDVTLRTAVAMAAVVSFLLTIAMLRRSALARRLLLVASTLLVALQITDSTIAAGPTAPLAAAYHAAVGILILVALSSPAATAWSSSGPPPSSDPGPGQPDAADQPSRLV